MGTRQSNLSASRAADALFTPVQQRLLGLLFGQPDRSFQSAEIIRKVSSGTGAVHRQLKRMADAGLLTVSRQGNQKHYRANVDAPIFSELRGLVLKTVGLVEPLRSALEPLADRILAAFVYGSVAKGKEQPDSDLDVMILSESVTYPDSYEALQAAEARLGRSINPTVLTPAEWKEKGKGTDSFVARIEAQPKLFVIGTEHELP